VQREVEKLQSFLKEFPDTEVWVVARTKLQATVCWKIISSQIEYKKTHIPVKRNDKWSKSSKCHYFIMWSVVRKQIKP